MRQTLAGDDDGEGGDDVCGDGVDGGRGSRRSRHDGQEGEERGTSGMDSHS